MRYFVRVGFRWHLIATPDATLTYCGRAVGPDDEVIEQRDEDTPPFACAECLLAEPPPRGGTPVELD
jgi:hypothetical protein